MGRRTRPAIVMFAILKLAKVPSLSIYSYFLDLIFSVVLNSGNTFML